MVDLGPVMPAAQFQATDEMINYLCMVRALTFEGSILTFSLTRNEVEWVPVWGLSNDLTPGEERSIISLANYMPCIPKEAGQIVKLGSCQIVNWSGDSSMTEEEGAEEEPMTDTERGEQKEGNQ